MLRFFTNKTVFTRTLCDVGKHSCQCRYDIIYAEKTSLPSVIWGGWVVRWYWVNFQCWGVLLIWIIVGQGPTALEVGGGCLGIFSLVYHLSPLSPLSGRRPDIDRYRLNYCLKGPLNPKQPTNQPSVIGYFYMRSFAICFFFFFFFLVGGGECCVIVFYFFFFFLFLFFFVFLSF